MGSRDDFKSKFDQKSAEFRAKDNKLQQQITALESEKSSLSKQSEQSKLSEDQLAKVKKLLEDEKNKSDRLRKIAKKYKDSDTAKAVELEQLKKKPELSTTDVQTDPTAEVNVESK